MQKVMIKEFRFQHFQWDRIWPYGIQFPLKTLKSLTYSVTTLRIGYSNFKRDFCSCMASSSVFALPTTINRVQCRVYYVERHTVKKRIVRKNSHSAFKQNSEISIDQNEITKYVMHPRS